MKHSMHRIGNSDRVHILIQYMVRDLPFECICQTIEVGQLNDSETTVAETPNSESEIATPHLGPNDPHGPHRVSS